MKSVGRKFSGGKALAPKFFIVIIGLNFCVVNVGKRLVPMRPERQREIKRKHQIRQKFEIFQLPLYPIIQVLDRGANF